MKSFILLLWLNVIPLFLISQSLEKGFELLNTGNYAEASEVFQHILQKENDHPAAQYGLAKTFFMKDNPQYNLDSANYYVLQSAGGLNREWKPGELKKFHAAGWREYNVTDLQQNINNEAYKVADESNSIDGWNHFIRNYSTSSQMQEAIHRRNTLAFTAALESNDYHSFEDFLNTYPDAEQTEEARALYEKLLYQTKTRDSTWQVYDSFIKSFPNSPYISRAKENYERLLFLDKTKSQLLADYILFTRDFPQSPYIAMAEDSIYSIATRSNTLESYLDFISFYPSNRNVMKSWQKVYEKETPVFSTEMIQAFSEKYPEFPDKGRVEKDLQLSKRNFTMIEVNGLFGYADTLVKDTAIAATLDEASPFSEGTAAVSVQCVKGKCKYSYINMQGKLITEESFDEANDFHNGLALVAIGDCSKDSCRYGFINRFGEWVIDPLYEVAFEFSEGFALVQKDSAGYGFVNEKGETAIPCQYKDASNFVEGVAAVQVNDSAALYGYVDRTGAWAIPPAFSMAGNFSESLAPAANDKKLWGYIDHAGNWVIEPKYEFAQPFNAGKATVIIKTKDPKHAGRFITKEKVIDKKGKYLQ